MIRILPGAKALARGLLAMALLAGIARGADDEDSFVRSGGEALRERAQIPWYDAKTDSLRPVELEEPWEPDLSVSWLAEPINFLVMLTIALLLTLAVWLVVRVIRQRERNRPRPQPAESDPLVTADRIEALPFLRERSHDDLLGQARHHYEQGNYGEAIIYLFSYQLVELDRSALVRLAKGKTNRQYVREAGRVRPLAALLSATMVTFEDVFFGQRNLDRDGFEACWNRLDQFENLIAQAKAPA